MSSMRLRSNNPARYKEGITDFGLSITARVPLLTEPNQKNPGSPQAKQDKPGHLLGLQQAAV
jgi:GTP cyclohydrolase II